MAGASARAWAHRHRRRLLMIATVTFAAVYAAAVVGGLLGLARLAAVLMAASATADIVDAHPTANPKGVAMVGVLAFALPLEGGARSAVQGMAEASFLELAIGGYMFATLMQMTRRGSA